MKKCYLFIFMCVLCLSQAYATATNVISHVTPRVVLSTQTITFNAIAAQTYGTADFSPGAIASSGLAVTYTSSNTAVATITSGGLIHIVGVGSSNITASQAGNATYSAATSVVQSLTVNVGTPVISFTSSATQVFGAADYTAASSTNTNAANPVSYTSSNASVAIIVSGKIHLTGVGATTITASQQADANYVAATSVQQTLTVNNPTITLGAFSAITYGAADLSPSITVSNSSTPTILTSDNPLVATIIAGKIHLIGAGTANITASQAAGTGYPAIVTAPQPLTVNAGPAPVITFNPITAGMTTADLAPSATATLYATTIYPITYTSDNPNVATIVNNRIHFTGTGTANITATLSGLGPNSTPVFTSASKTVALTVNPPVLTFTTNMAGKTLSTTDFDPAASSTWLGPITYTSSDATIAIPSNNGLRLHIVGVSSANPTITASLNYPTSPTTTGTITATNTTLSVTGTPAAIVFTATKSVAYGVADFAGGATSAGNTLVPISYSSDNAAVATIVNNQVHITGQGVAHITATQGGGALGTTILPPDAVQTLTVTSPTLSLTALGTKVLTSTDLAPTVTTSIPVTTIPVTYASSNTAVATIVNNLIHFTGLGTTTITATQGGGAIGTSILPADATSVMTVSAAAANTITLPTFGTQVLGSSDFYANASSSVINIPITYSSNNIGVATINPMSGLIHLVGVGAAVITASQGNVVVPDVTSTLTVSATPTITFATLGSKAFNSVDIDPGATVNAAGTITYTSSNPAVASIVNNKIHFVAVLPAVPAGNNQTIITATFTPANSGVAAALPVTSVLTVTMPTLSLAAIAAKTGFVSDFAAVPTTTLPNVPVTYTSSDPEVATIVNGAIHITGPGTTQITASQAVAAIAQSYPAPADATTGFSVTVQPPAITFAALGAKPFGTADFAPGATNATNPLPPITYTTSDPTVAIIVNGNIHLVGTGACVITAQQGAAPGFIAPLNQTQLLTVLPAAITFNTLGVVPLNATDITLGATSTLSKTTYPILYTSSNPSVATILNPSAGVYTLHMVAPGTAIITATQPSAPGNTMPVPVTSTIVVTQPLITFPILGTKPLSNPGNTADVALAATSTVPAIPLTYTSSNPAVASIVYGGFTTPYLHTSGVGSSIITVSQGGGAAGTATLPADVSQVFTVTAPTITFGSLGSKPFNSTDLALAATSSIKFQSDGVTPLPITYTSSDTTIVKISNPTTAPAIHYVGLGVAIITASQGGGPAGTAALPADVSQPITVTLPTLTVSTALGSKPFNATDLTLAATATSSATVTFASSNPNVATIVYGAVHFIGIGSTNITASQPATGNLPAITSPVVVLTVTQPAITLAATKTITLPSANVDPAATSTIPTTTYPVVYASSNPAVATIVSGIVHPVSAGVSIITASQPVPLNSAFTAPPSATMVLTVAQTTETFNFLPFSAPLQIGVADFSPATSTGDPVSYTSSNSAVATIVNGLVHLVGPGTVNITATLLPSGNYFNAGPSSITQPLTVVTGAQQIALYYPATQSTSPAAVPVLVKGTGVYQTNILSCSTASIPTGLLLTIVSADSTIVKVVGQGLLPVHVGFTSVTFSQPGNSNYTAATPVTLFVQVVDPSYAPVIVHQALSPNGDGINDFLLLEGLQDHANNHVVIVDRNGAKVFEADNYNNRDVVFIGKSNHNGKNLPGGTYFYLIDYPDGLSHTKLTGYFVLKY